MFTLRLNMFARAMSFRSTFRRICSKINSTFSRRLRLPKVSTAKSCSVSAALSTSPLAYSISDMHRLTRARSTSRNTLPAVISRKVSMIFILAASFNELSPIARACRIRAVMRSSSLPSRSSLSFSDGLLSAFFDSSSTAIFSAASVSSMATSWVCSESLPIMV